MPSNAGDYELYLPLTPVVFDIMLALSDGARHGYAIMQEVAHRSDGRTQIRPGTLYRAINRLVEDGFVEEVHPDNVREPTDARRRYYALTSLGRRVASAEARRLEEQVVTARLKRLLRPGNA